jgi:hypothetical protein
VPDVLWKCTVFGAGKPYANDQIEDMVQGKGGVAAFEKWVKAFVAYVETKGTVRGTTEAERSAHCTTNLDKKKVG